MEYPLKHDSWFGKPFIDVDEWRAKPRPHRYVHGGFETTDTLFSVYFPPREDYDGRFLQGIPGGDAPTGRGASVRGILNLLSIFALRAYFVETNLGHTGYDFSGLRGESSIAEWRANAEAARVAASLASDMYGYRPRFGYIYGESVNARRAIAALENASDVYDGGISLAMLNSATLALESARANAARVLYPNLASVVAATQPGGSMNPFEGLNSAQREALALLYRLGFPLGAEFQLANLAALWSGYVRRLKAYDPGYFIDFWRTPGYGGRDDGIVGAVIHERLRASSALPLHEVRKLPGDDIAGLRWWLARSRPADERVGLVLRNWDPPQNLWAANLRVISGNRSGASCFVSGVLGNTLIAADYEASTSPFEGIEDGDVIEIDDRDFLAFCHYHRHQQIPGRPGAPMTVHGRSIYPQRKTYVPWPTPGELSGSFRGKLMLLQNTVDWAGWPVAALDYADLVAAAGGDNGDRFRFYLIENATHQPPYQLVASRTMFPVPETRVIDPLGWLDVALGYLFDWVESGIKPPTSTSFSLDKDNQVSLPQTANERGGLQPALALRTLAKDAVVVGADVEFELSGTCPKDAGGFAVVEWDFEGKGDWPLREPLVGLPRSLRTTARYQFVKPGNYYVAARVTASRGIWSTGREATNICRARVDVSERVDVPLAAP